MISQLLRNNIAYHQRLLVNNPIHGHLFDVQIVSPVCRQHRIDPCINPRYLHTINKIDPNILRLERLLLGKVPASMRTFLG